MLRPCDKSVRCFPCSDESSNPFANLTTEIPDRNIYAGVVFRRVPNPPLNNWNQDSCVGVCESSVSQQDADDCAARKALECIINTQPPPNPNNPSWTPLFCNTLKSAQFGSDCYTILPCTVNAFSVAEANAIAQSLADYRVHDAALSEPCTVAPPAPELPPPLPLPEPEPPVPCTECCNCGAIVAIESFDPALFTFDPASLDSIDQYNIPDNGNRNLSGVVVNVPDGGWDACIGEVKTTFGFFKQGGNWFRVDAAGFCIPLVDAKILIRTIQAYPAGVPVDGLVAIKKNPYDLNFGTGAWNGQFTLTDDSFTTCAVQGFSAKHINGYGGFTVQLDVSGPGPDFLWTLTFTQYYPQGEFGTPQILWVGEHNGPTQCGTYTRTAGDVFTGPASLSLEGVV